MAIDEQALLARVRRIEDYLAQVGQQIGIPFEIPGASTVPPEVLEMVRNGDRLQAVVRLREQGLSLGEAKQIVDGL
jgi:hypothetical protein